MWILLIIIGIPLSFLGIIALGDWLLGIHEKNEEKKYGKETMVERLQRQDGEKASKST